MTTPNRRSATTPEATTEAPEEYVEYLGDQYGTEFIDERVISRADAKRGWDLDIPEDLRWVKRMKGGKERMLVPTSSIPPEALESLLADKAFKVVTK